MSPAEAEAVAEVVVTAVGAEAAVAVAAYLATLQDTIRRRQW